MPLAESQSVSSRSHVLLGRSPAMQALQVDIDSAARSDAKVLLTGETGAGKEVVARAIHQRSRRNPGPFVTINCAGVPDSLLESEFFGHVKGSFTGAFRDSQGLLRQANHGTVFLDEVGEMSLRMQALLLRFLETGEVQTVGSSVTSSTSDVRVITATNRNLLDAIGAREFREDLFYRLNVLHLHVPALRDRAADVLELLTHYIAVFSEQHRMTAPDLTPAAADRLTGYSWPGNVRELRNVVERLVLRAGKGVIEVEQLPAEVLVASAGAAQSSWGLPPAGSPSNLPASHSARLDLLVDRLLACKESFWATVYPTFMSRDMTREDLRQIVRAGLERTHGSYRVLLVRDTTYVACRLPCTARRPFTMRPGRAGTIGP